MSWVSRLANVFRSRRTAAELDEELRFHLEQRAEELIGSGLSREEAERGARRRLGNRLALREASQEIRSAVWLESLLLDFRFGMRMLWKFRAASFAAVASLALAIGACTAAFSLIDALILRPLPVREPGQLFDLALLTPPFWSPDNQSHEYNLFTPAAFELLSQSVKDSADLFVVDHTGGAFRQAVFDNTGGVRENVNTSEVSGRAFEILGIKPAIGRLIQSDDDSLSDPHPVAVLSYPFWTRRFGANPSILGHWITLDNNRSFQIIGVAGRKFTGGQPGYLVDLWTPLSSSEDPRIVADLRADFLDVWGRLHPGVRRAQLHERLQAAFTAAQAEGIRVYPPPNLHGDRLKQFAEEKLLVRDASTGSGRDSLFRAQFRRPFEILALICGLLLLVACSNVANLMLARGSARDAEMALRTSLGAARWRLIQQMLIESAQLAFVATIFAVMFAAFAAPAMVARLGPSEFPAFLDVAPDLRSLGFAAALSLFSTIFFGLVPALRASSARPEAALKSAGHSARIGSLRWMLTAQIGCSVAIVFLSGLLLLSFRKLVSVDLGFNRASVVLFDFNPRDRDPLRHSPVSAQTLLERIRALPGVRAASLTAQRPMGGDMVWIMTPVIRFPGRGSEMIRPAAIPVSDGFFSAMQIRWISGRDFLPEEIARGSASVVVNQAFVDTFLAGTNALGVVFETIGDDFKPVRHQIIGVAATTHYNRPSEPDRPTIYTPLDDASRAVLNVRAGSTSGATLAWLRRQIEASAPELAVRSSVLLASEIDNTLLSQRLLALLAGFFSIVALLLAGVGLYGVIHYAAIRRTREIGIRMALGARRGSVVRLVMSDGSIAVIAGIALGIVVGMALARYLVSQLFGVKPTDFWSLADPVTCVLIASIAASLPPALGAASADPLIALRHE